MPPASVGDEAAFEAAMGTFADPGVRAGVIVPYTEAREIADPALAALRSASGHAP